MKKKLIALALVTIIAVMAIAGSSLAWLQDTTETVTNTFTEGKVDIDLYETKDGTKVMGQEYKMVPGDELTKDPTVEVLPVSEACWLFVKVEENATVDTFLTYAIADGWTELEAGVYYREVEDTNAVQTFAVLKNNKVTVKTEVNMDQMNALTGGTLARPELKFTAYAVQKANVASAADAWDIINPASGN